MYFVKMSVNDIPRVFFCFFKAFFLSHEAIIMYIWFLQSSRAVIAARARYSKSACQCTQLGTL